MKCGYFFIFFVVLCLLSFSLQGCAGIVVSAEEYYFIGMAYFDIGKYDEAEKWLNRAKQARRTMVASAYNLGRLSFEMQRYEEAAKHFESILKRDKDNVPALKAAAYSRIRSNEIEKAEKHYTRLLELVPESADDGYNHALILFVLGKYKQSEEILEKYPIALQENKDVMLLYARNQGAQNKVEAIETYSTFLANHSDPKARYEYACLLDKNELYARAIEEYRKSLTEIKSDSLDPKKSDVRFELARVLLIAESASSDGITELKGAVSDGFNDIAAVEKLKVGASNREALNEIVKGMREKEAAEAAKAAASEVPDISAD
jgi:tetratricopeptide (TPR) repeat protein